MSVKKLADLSSNSIYANKNSLSTGSIILALVLTIVAFLLFSQGIDSWGKARENQQQSLRQQADQVLSKSVSEMTLVINKSIKTINEVLPARLDINDFNINNWQNYQTELSVRLGRKIEIYGIPHNYNPDKIIDNPKLGYVILSLLNDLQEQDSVNLEARQAADRQGQVIFVHKVNNAVSEAEVETVGYLVINIDSRLFSQFISHFDTEQGYIEMIQRSAAKALVLNSKGDSSLKASGFSVIKKIPGSRWLFKLWPAPSGKQFLFSYYWQPVLYGVLGLLALIAGLMVFYKYVIKARKANYISFPERQISPFSKQKENAHLDSSVAQEGLDGIMSNESFSDMIDKIFLPYDIRGITGEQVTPQIFQKIAYAIAQEAMDKDQHALAVARDGRNSSPELANALIDGLRQSGINVLDIGMVPTPVLYFAAVNKCDGNGIMVTAGHNPANYNGLKIMLAGNTYSSLELESLKEKIFSEATVQGEGSVNKYNILEEYVTKITANIILARPMNIVIDTGNGVAGVIAQTLFEQLGCNVTSINSEVDGSFPNHMPDPSRPENMAQLSSTVIAQKADIGFAFDADGDALGIISSGGEIVWPDRILMFLAKDILSRNKGVSILYDVKSSKNVSRFISHHGGKSSMCPCGHSLMKKQLRELGAILAGEMSGHFFIKERWYGFDDALFAAARVLEILSIDLRKSRQVFAELPDALNTPEILLPVENPHAIIVSLLADTRVFKDAKLFTMDGLRAEYSRGWGLVRASNTANNLSLRFEADDESALQEIAQIFKDAVLGVAPEVQFPF